MKTKVLANWAIMAFLHKAYKEGFRFWVPSKNGKFKKRNTNDEGWEGYQFCSVGKIMPRPMVLADKNDNVVYVFKGWDFSKNLINVFLKIGLPKPDGFDDFEVVDVIEPTSEESFDDLPEYGAYPDPKRGGR